MCLQARTAPGSDSVLSPFRSTRCKHSDCYAKLISLGLSSSLIFRDNSFKFSSCRWRCGFQLVLEVHEYERQLLFSHSPLKLEMMIFPANEHTLISTVRKHSWEHKNSVPKSLDNHQFNCPWEALSFILGKPARKRSTYPV